MGEINGLFNNILIDQFEQNFEQKHKQDAFKDVKSLKRCCLKCVGKHVHTMVFVEYVNNQINDILTDYISMS